MIAPGAARTEPAPDYPAWVGRLYPAGLPDELLFEQPASDAQIRYLRVLGVTGRWCSREEASGLINRIVKAHKKAARAAATKHGEGTP